jgi:hypothetical protein
MKLDITRDLQSSNVLELSNAELAVVSGGNMGYGYQGDGDRRDRRDRDDRRRFDRGGYGYWQDSDCFGGYDSQQQVFFVDQQSSPCAVIQSYCGY